MKKLTIILSMGLMFVLTFSINATTYTSTATGNWSTQAWSPVGTPGATDDVVIADGHTVTIDQNVSIANLTVGGGTSGILTFDATTGRAVTVSGNVTVSAGVLSLSFQALTPTGDLTLGSGVVTNVSSTAGVGAGWNISGTGVAAAATVLGFDATTITMSAVATATGTGVVLSIKPTLTNTFSIGGDLTNNGTFDMSLGSASTVCNVTFNKVGTQTISGTTPVLTRFRGITLNKGGVANKVTSSINAFMASLNITFTSGTWEQTAGRLTATSGSQTVATTGAMIISGSGSITIASNLNINGTLTVNTSDTVSVGALQVLAN